MLLVNNVMPPKKMQYEIIIISTYNQCDEIYRTQINECDWLLFVYHGTILITIPEVNVYSTYIC